MGTIPNKTPLVFIVGATASGKSALAVDVAQRFGGEIICADSRTVYRGMNIGTAKPSLAEQKKVKHHLLDLVTPDQKFNVREFQQLAAQAIKDINKRGKLPIIAGGTGLYVDAVLFDYQFSPPGARKSELNPRHLKYQELTAYQKSLRPNILVMGLNHSKEVSAARIKQRVESMFSSGLADEVDVLIQKYGWDAPGLQTIGYQEFRPFFEHTQSLEEVKKQVERSTILFAKRQRTWFKRNKNIHWMDDPEQAVDLITTLMNN